MTDHGFALTPLPQLDGQFDYFDPNEFFLDPVLPKQGVKSEPCLEGMYLGDISDPGLMNLAQAAQETGSLLPLIKEEIKCKIQAKRLASGQCELKLDDHTEKAFELTDEDIRRKETRRAQNRRAAKKYRLKQRDILTTDRQEKCRLQGENNALRSEVKQLREEKAALMELLRQHMMECTSREAVVPECYMNDSNFFMN